MKWKPLPTRYRCEEMAVVDQVYQFSSSNPLEIDIPADACYGKDNQVKYLEHAQVSQLEECQRNDYCERIISKKGISLVMVHTIALTSLNGLPYTLISIPDRENTRFKI